jgi:thiosulfate/3-mercaptopyruvate sulfurtransferase
LKHATSYILALLLLPVLLFPAYPAWAVEALVSARWLMAHARDPGLTVVDIRPESQYFKGHIPSARNIPFSAPVWRESRYGVPGFLPAPRKIAKVLERYGISRGTPLVIVSAGGGARQMARAARVFWSLRVLGQKALYLLDGGMNSWRGKLAGGPPAPVNPARYTPKPDPSILATLEQTQDALDNNIPPIDARGMDYFYGYKNDLDDEDGGTILDAINVPASSLLDAHGHFLPAPDLRKAFLARGAVLDQGKVITFSTYGVMAALDWFALREILHVPDVRLYDGSLAEWAAEGMDMYDSTDGMGGAIGG